MANETKDGPGTNSRAKQTANAVAAKKRVVKKVAKKTVAKKKVAKKKVVRKQRAGQTAAAPGTGGTTARRRAGASAEIAESGFSPRERYEMIAKMAYFKAEKRGFEPGWEQQDWLESERAIDEMSSKERQRA